MEPPDQWCEQRMWRKLNVDTNVEIICAITGIAFIIVPYVEPPPEWTDYHIMFHVVFVFLGLGTILYHAFPNFESSNQATIYELDWYPMVFTCAFLLFIYLLPLNKYLSQLGVYLLYFSFMSWFAFLVLSVYHVSVEVRNAVMVTVPVFVFFCYSVTTFGARSFYTWVLLITSLIIWNVNKAVCDQQYWLATFHGIYHVLMAFALWSAGCLGLDVARLT